MHSLSKSKFVLGICSGDAGLVARVRGYLLRKNLDAFVSVVEARLVTLEVASSNLDPARVFIDSKDEFIDRCDFAIAQVGKPPGFETISYAASFVQAALRPQSQKRVLVVSNSIEQLDSIWREESALASDPLCYTRALREQRVLLTKKFSNEFLATLLRAQVRHCES